jgi:UDP-glucose-4-epimerase GalE
MKSVLVTGGAGYIGSHVVSELLRRGYHTVIYDNLSSGHLWAILGGEFICGDLGDRDALSAALRSRPFEAVLHFAAHAFVGESMRNATRYFQNNVANTINLLDAMVHHQMVPLIFSSSCAIYGNPQTIPIPEDHVMAPINPYGETKAIIERSLAWYSKVHGLRYVALRYFNAAGSNGRIGEVHDPEPHIIPRTLLAALGRIPQVEIFGTDYPTPDGTCVRDYIHVADLADAHILALEYLLDGGRSDAFNLGTESGHSVREIVEAARKITGRRIPTREAERREGDPPELVARAIKARELLGWQPKRSDLEDMIGSTWRFFTRHEDLLPSANSGRRRSGLRRP